MTLSSRDGDPAALAVPFDELPAELRVSAFGVDYAHVRVPEGGDLYLTRYGWPRLAQLLPANWYADRWYAQHGERLPGSTGHAYHVVTRPAEGRQADVVVKFSRVAQDVPLTIATSFPDTVPPEVLANARFNSPWEEFGLVMELRRGGCGPPGLRILTQHPMAVYAPPEEYALWQLGRSEGSFLQHDRLLAEDQENAGRAIELDIRRIYAVVYQWIKGWDAEAFFEAGQLGAEDFRGFTPRVIGELQESGYRVLDNKPKHFILRKRSSDGQILRRGDGRVTYALVDFELLQRTPEHQRQFKVRQGRRYWDLLGQRDQPSPTPLPSHLQPAKIFGVSYVMGSVPDGGKLWLVGQDAELWDYFSPDRWLRTPRLKLSPVNEVYRTRTRDGIHVVYRRSRVGTRPRVDPLLENNRQMREYGFNSPFEETAIAELLRQMGIPTTRPRAIYRTDHPTTTAEYLRDDRRFADHADLRTPGPLPESILSRAHDYYSIWDYFRGIDPHGPAGQPQGRRTDLERARDDGLLSHQEHAELIEDTRRRLRSLGLADAALQDHECIVTIGEDGRLCRDRQGGVEVSLSIDALTAYDYGLLPAEEYRRLTARLDERLRAVDCEALDLAGNHLLLSMNPDGQLKTNEAGEIEVALCNFELIRGLYRPLRPPPGAPWWWC